MLYLDGMGVFDRRIKHKNGTVSVMRYIRWYLPGGKAVTRSLGPASEITKTEAKEILAQESGQDKKKKRHGQLQYEDPVFSQYTDTYIKYARDIQKKRSWKRDVSTVGNLKEFFGNKHLSEITVKEINKYREARLEKGRTQRTINLELSCLSKIFKLAKENEQYYGDIPVSKIKQFEIQNAKDRILTPDEELRLLDVSPPHLRVIISCALNTGMRRGEIISLKWNSVKLDQGYISLEATNTKSKKHRNIPISSVMEELLIDIKENNNSKYVFLNAAGLPYQDGTGIRKVFYTARRKASIENLRFHDLRHTAATRMVESGVPLFQVGQILGHTDPKTTMRYAHPDESLKDAIEALASYNRTIHSNTKNKETRKASVTD